MSTRLADLGSGIAPPAGLGPTAPAAGTDRRSAGRLADLRRWLAEVQGTDPAHEPRRARMLHLGAGSGCPDAAAELAQLSVREVPVTVVAPSGVAAAQHTAFPAELPGTPPRDEHPDAGIADQIAAGVALADAEIDTGTDLVVLSLPDAEVLGPALVCVITGVEPVKLLPRGAGLSVADWTGLAVAVRDMRRGLVAAADDPDTLLAAACRLAADHASAAATEPCRLAVACGLLLQLTSRRTPVVLDGIGAAAAAALCAQAAPVATAWWRAAELGGDPAYDAAITHMALAPVLPVAAGGAGGVAGALAVLTLRMAVRSVAS